jgi:hypothetical protein
VVYCHRGNLKFYQSTSVGYVELITTSYHQFYEEVDFNATIDRTPVAWPITTPPSTARW